MCIALLLPLIRGSIDHGGFANIWRISQNNGRIVFDNFSLDPTVTYSFWSAFIGSFFTWLIVFGVNQSMVQRILSVKTLKQARASYWCSLIGFNFVLATTFLSGLVLYAEYGECNPMKMNSSISATDQILPYYIYQTFEKVPGIMGLFIAGITSAGLSSISSGTNSLVSVTMNDLFPGLFNKISPRKQFIASKLLGLFFGGMTLLFAYLSSFMGSVLKAALGLFGMLSGPVLGVFTLGILVPQGNFKGSLSGQIIATAITLWVGLGKYSYPKVKTKRVNDHFACDKLNRSMNLLNSPYPVNNYVGLENLYNISFLYLSMIGFFLSLSIGIIVSLATGGNKRSKVNSLLLWKYIRPFGRDHHEEVKSKITELQIDEAM